MKTNKKTRFLYYSGIFSSAVICAAMLIIGCAVVRVNCHNAMNADKIELFSVEKSGGKTVVIVMGKEYYIDF